MCSLRTIEDTLGTFDLQADPPLDKTSIVSRLQALARDDSLRSKTARLRGMLSDVEATLAAGVSRGHVLEALNDHGFDMSLSTFATILKRLRAERSKFASLGNNLAPPP